MKSQLIAIVAAVLVVGCSDHEAEANKLFVKASTVPQREAVEILEKILVQYPETSLAVGISGGSQKINGYSLEEIKLDIKRQEWEEKKRRQAENQRQMVSSSKSGDIRTLKESLANGANVNVIVDRKRRTPLHEAANKEVAELLIAAGADINAKASWGRTPLHDAARRGRKEIAELLIAKGADVNATILLSAGTSGDNLETPLDSANENSQTETAALLRKHGGLRGAKNNQ